MWWQQQTLGQQMPPKLIIVHDQPRLIYVVWLDVFYSEGEEGTKTNSEHR